MTPTIHQLGVRLRRKSERETFALLAQWLVRYQVNTESVDDILRRFPEYDRQDVIDGLKVYAELIELPLREEPR
jgi:hypothetical protein